MVPREKHPKEGEKMSKFLVLIALVAMTIIALPATATADDEKTMVTFPYGLASGGLGTAHVVGFGFHFPKLDGDGIAGKIEFQYLSYIDSRGTLNLQGWYGSNDFFASTTPSRQGTVIFGIGSTLGKNQKKYGYFCVEVIRGTTKGMSIRTYEIFGVVKQEIKSDNISYAGLGVGPDIEIYPVKHFSMLVGGRAGFLNASTAFGKPLNNQKYWRGFAILNVRL